MKDDGTIIALAAVGVVAAASLASGRQGSRYRTEDEVLSVRSTDGLAFNVRLVPPGGSYGLNNKLKNLKSQRHSSGKAMVEFYFPASASPWPSLSQDMKDFYRKFGNFTGERYNISTLMKDHHTGKGLALQNGAASFSAKTINDILVWSVGGNPKGMWG